MQNVHLLFIIRFVSLSVPTYCILMQLLVYFTVSDVRQRDEYESDWNATH